MNRYVSAAVLGGIGLLVTIEGMQMAPVPGPNSTPAPGWRVDPGTASRAELHLLPGIGPVMAERVLRARSASAHRDWGSLADLDAIPGIGPRTIEGLRPWMSRGVDVLPGEFETEH
ncbi:MAG: helix-hairpin-helix domain-containing protein [Phycisphaerales bacterium]|nr:helix-hairpin-helix domain-containing protein [Phycisphaerales bacterium]